MELTRDFLLSYDTVCLRPRYSYLKSRAEANTSIDFLGRTFKLPVVPANMKDVISVDNAKYLSENDYFYIYHRFGEKDNGFLHNYEFVERANAENWKLISISIGINGPHHLLIEQLKKSNFRVDFITIDVAHAHHENTAEMIDFIRDNLGNVKLIVGNIATGEAAIYIASQRIDALKVGIGGGSICTTRYQTGFHLPTLQSVFEAHQSLNSVDLEVEVDRDLPIIADGGAKHYGDIAKALTLGASMVMSGGWFASCIDSPARIEHGKKIYRGSTSYEAKGEKRHIEGRALALDEGITYAERLQEIKQALQSSISYAGGEDLTAFNFVEWERITPNH